MPNIRQTRSMSDLVLEGVVERRFDLAVRMIGHWRAARAVVEQGVSHPKTPPHPDGRNLNPVSRPS